MNFVGNQNERRWLSLLLSPLYLFVMIESNKHAAKESVSITLFESVDSTFIVRNIKMQPVWHFVPSIIFAGLFFFPLRFAMFVEGNAIFQRKKETKVVTSELGAKHE